MALEYDPQALINAVERLFITLSQTHPDPDIAGLESSITAAKVHEHNSLEEALHDSPIKTEGVKPRVVILSSATRKADGLPVFYVRKGRENRDRSVQIGRTWGLETLTSLDVPPENSSILILGFKKPYYWVFANSDLRQDFESKLREISRNYLHREVPSILTPPVPEVSRKRSVLNASRQASQPVPQQPVSQQNYRPEMHQASQQTSRQLPQTQLAPQAPQHHVQPQQIPRQMSPSRSVNQGDLQQRDPVIPQRTTSQRSMPAAAPAVYPSSPSGAPTASSHALPQTPMVGAEGLVSSPPQFPTPPPHSITPVPSEPISQVEPLRSFNKKSGPQIPQRAPTRSSRHRQGQPSKHLSRPAADTDANSSKSSLASSRNDANSRFASPMDTEPRPEISRSPPAASRPLSPTSGPANAINDGLTGGMIETGRKLPQPANWTHDQDSKVLQPSATFEPVPPAMRPDSPERRGSSSLLFNSQFSPLKSPINNGPLRARSPSIAPLTANSSPESRQLQDLLSVIDELKWEGTDVLELERGMKSRLDQISYQNLSGVVDLDNHFDDLNGFIKKCAEELNRVDAKMRAVAMNLVGKGEEVTSMEGQSDGLQILTLNYKKLATEIEKLLDVSRLDDHFVRQLSNVEFGDPTDPRTPENVLHIEDLLVDLNQALELFTHRADIGDSGSTTMEAFQEPKRTAQNLALNFGKQYQKFVEREFHKVFASPTSMDAIMTQSLEYKLFVNMYMFSRCLLFIRESVPSVHKSILLNYEKQAQPVYQNELAKYLRSWSSNIENITSHNRKSRSIDTRQGMSLAESQSLPGELAKQAQLNLLSESGTRQLHTSIHNGIFNFCLRIASQQCFLEKFFHLGSDSDQRFTSFSSQGPLRLQQIKDEERVRAVFEEMTYLDINATKSEMWSVKEIMQELFSNAGDILYRELAKLISVAPFQTVYLIMILDIRSYEMRLTNQQFLAAVLSKIQKQVSDSWEEILRNHTRLILSAHFTTKKRVGVHPVVALFTEHVSIIEASVAAALDTETMRRQRISVQALSRASYWGDTTRQMVDRSYGNMFRAIAQGLRMGAAAGEIQGSSGINAATRLKAAARETTGSGPAPGEETKELLNRHVVMIENLYRIHKDLEKFKSLGVQNIVQDAKQHYQRELDGYIADVISRPVGKIVTFVKQHESRSVHPVKQKESISALKRVAKGYDLKELRTGIEQLHKRVEKHFSGSDPAIFALVWQAIRTEYVNLFTKLTRIAQNLEAQTYIEFQVADVNSAFM